MKKMIDEIYKKIIENANEGVVVIKEEKIIYVNDYGLKTIGYSYEEVIGKNLLEFFREKDKNKVFENYKRTMQGIINPMYTAVFCHKNGEKITVEINAKKITTSEGDILFAIIRNNSIKEKLDLIFKEQEERLYNLTENTPDMIARLDEDCRYIYVNSAMEKTFNIPRKDFFWKNNEELGIKNEEDVTLKEAILFVFQNKEKKSFYSKTIIDNENKYHFTILIPEFYTDGTVKSVLSITRDITEIKEIDQVKSDFISTTTHQLRSPLSIVKWCSLSLLEEDLNETAKDYVCRIQKASKDLIKITDVFLNTTILDLEMFILHYKKFNVKAFLEEIIFTFKYIIEEKEIIFINECDSELQIKFDENVLKITLRGLLSNALEYTEKGGTVRVSIYKENKDMIIVVSDSGCGIPPEEQRKVFTKFYRSNIAKSIRAYGTGLDLYIIKSFISKASGDIKLESPNPEFGKGTIFTIKIPLTK